MGEMADALIADGLAPDDDGPQPDDELFCRNCGQVARTLDTKFGRKDVCDDCDWWSWGGKPLVPREVHEARIRAHDAVDALWKHAHLLAYDVAEPEGTEARQRAVKRITKAARGRTYRYIADKLGVPRDELHMATIEDVTLLEAIRVIAMCANPVTIRRWWHEDGKRKRKR